MRVLKFFLTGIAVAVTLAIGLIAAFFAAALAVLIHLARRLGGKPAAPTARRSAAAAPPRATRAARDDAIDITATEVPSDPPAR